MRLQSVLGRKPIGIATGIAVTAALLRRRRRFDKVGARMIATQELREAIDNGRAKNVILLLGDGMGDSEITIARNYQVGASGTALDGYPPADRRLHDLRVAGIESLADRLCDGFGGVGTGWATGLKTSNGRISALRRHGQHGDQH